MSSFLSNDLRQFDYKHCYSDSHRNGHYTKAPLTTVPADCKLVSLVFNCLKSCLTNKRFSL